MKIVFTPDWFLGGDVLIEIFSFFVLVAFYLIAYRSYKLSKNKNIRNLGIGFLLIAVAEISTILTKAVLYYDTSFVQEIGHMIVTYHVVQSVDIFYYIGFFINKLLTLGGLYVIYRINGKKTDNGEILLGAYFIIVAALFSYSAYYLFHLTALLLLVLISSNYLEIYRKNKSRNTLILIVAFSILGLSRILFLMSKVNIFYVSGQLLQLVSYLILLFLIIQIRKHGKKKKQK